MFGEDSCPRLGFIVLGLITLFIVLTSQRGRFHCGWLCPMGAFNERILSGKQTVHGAIKIIDVSNVRNVVKASLEQWSGIF